MQTELLKVVKELIEQTRQGQEQWYTVGGFGMADRSTEDYAVSRPLQTLEVYRDQNDTIVFARLDDSGNPIDQIAAQKGDGNYPLLEELIDLAKSKAKKPDELLRLGGNLARMRQLLKETSDSALTEEELDARLEELLTATNQAAERSAELAGTLRPRFLLPRSEDVDIRLVPVSQLARFNEYRSDENIAYMLAGVFGGTVLGILANWVTDPRFSITQLSLVLMGFLATLTVLSVGWIVRIRRRAEKLEGQMLDRQAVLLPAIPLPMKARSPRARPEETGQPETERTEDSP